MSRRRKHENDSDSDEESLPTSRNQTPLSQASNGSKRIRLSGHGDGADEPSTQNGDSDTHIPLLAVPQRPRTNGLNGTNGVDTNKHAPGAIVRMKLTNFVTFSSAEVAPGPKLNMVLGPNGTGKSTLVCAICLGLGWGPQHLGRAKDVGEFVKNGCREATIEIELAGGHIRRRNPVIRRVIKHEGNKSTFTINGNASTRNDVLKLAREFSIQIDNLCQFLPQDKVSEFAALSPVELLHSTQRAAAGPEMIQWHETLKKLRGDQKRLQLANGADKEQLTNLENRQEMQRADVERMRQRAEIKKRIELLEKVRPIPTYRKEHKEMREAKDKKAELEKELEELKTQSEPAVRATNAKKDYVDEIDDVVLYQKDMVNEADAEAKKIAGELERVDGTIRDFNSQIEAERKAGVKHRENIKHYQQNINKLDRQIEEEEPEEFDAAFYTEQIREKTRVIRELNAKANEFQEKKREIAREYREKESKIKEAQARLQNLDSQAGQQEARLESVSPETAKAWRWIKNNPDKFEKQVFGPPMVECSVKDPRYADVLESLFQRNDFLVFTAQTNKDFKTLQEVLSIGMKLHDISMKVCSHQVDSFQPPISREQLHSLSFDGWAKDYITGPDPVLALLCSENSLHRTPLVLRDITDEEYKRMESGPLSVWVAGKQSYQVVRRREYGPDASSTRVRPVRPARYWTNQPVDTSAKDGIQESIRGWNEELQQIRQRLESDKAKVAQISEQNNELTKEKMQLDHEKAQKQQALVNYKALPMKRQQQQERLEPAIEAFERVKDRVQELHVEQDKAFLEKAEIAIQYADAVDQIRELYEKLLVSEFRKIEATSDLDTLRARNVDIRENLKTKSAEVAVAQADYKRRRDGIQKNLQPQAQALANEGKRDPELFAILDQVKELDPDQLEAEIDSAKASYEFTHEGNANVIHEFERRQVTIDQLREKLADFEKELNDLDAGIAEIREKWEPKLEAIVQRISNAFSESFAGIGCAGQVSVDKAEHLIPGSRAARNDNEADDTNTTTPHTSNSSDFDQWSIKIQVKFREHEALSVLDSHRQSGGERAVSTIFYLMALQSLSSSPFRVVDEINQGMDPRNERMVHERMVDIACNPNENAGGQYFLITPKLLNGLVYKRGMHVLNILSGEHMPKRYEQLDLKKCVARRREVVAARRKRMANGVNGVGVGA
ncbi:Structural maintenance of chromosomes protein 5 [Arachnomyces sp. PD_36]|nr:Structural maintenance of chromosomes protein 5 [Arachnomyces sp. PD_36]